MALSIAQFDDQLGYDLPAGHGRYVVPLADFESDQSITVKDDHFGEVVDVLGGGVDIHGFAIGDDAGTPLVLVIGPTATYTGVLNVMTNGYIPA